MTHNPASPMTQNTAYETVKGGMIVDSVLIFDRPSYDPPEQA